MVGFNSDQAILFTLGISERWS